MSSAVLDTSAVLAWLREEHGGDRVAPLLPSGVMSAVNWSETAQKIAKHAAGDARVLTRLQALGLWVEPFTADDALASAELWAETRSAGLSLVDRACLSVAARLGLPAVTALRPANCWLLASSGISVRRSERSSARQLIR